MDVSSLSSLDGISELTTAGLPLRRRRDTRTPSPFPSKRSKVGEKKEGTARSGTQTGRKRGRRKTKDTREIRSYFRPELTLKVPESNTFPTVPLTELQGLRKMGELKTTLTAEEIIHRFSSNRSLVSGEVEAKEGMEMHFGETLQDADVGKTTVEPVLCSNVCVEVPIRLLRLSSLSDILSFDVYNSKLSDSERLYLQSMLPDLSQESAVGDVVVSRKQLIKDLLSGENFFFGNPVQKFWDALRDGEFHPFVQRVQQPLIELEKAHSQVISHAHTNCISRFLTVCASHEQWGLPDDESGTDDERK
eukprot:TRINITY_DN781_c0_g5_i1.p1 TRINITY_DN781_c0_g5~~TRINITY_DN781_c0_g5_i1.p1  ORF type:complete len:339 (-),score=86.29 TRINITY_DN781_c0_g5_i1:96-1010(-)